MRFVPAAVSFFPSENPHLEGSSINRQNPDVKEQRGWSCCCALIGFYHRRFDSACRSSISLCIYLESTAIRYWNTKYYADNSHCSLEITIVFAMAPFVQGCALLHCTRRTCDCHRAQSEALRDSSVSNLRVPVPNAKIPIRTQNERNPHLDVLR